MTEAVDPDYRHPKCYANLYGGCSTKISGEHYVSHALIKLYTFDDPDVTIKHSHGFGIRNHVRPKNFVVNALCTNHNSALSMTDDAALEFARFLRTIALRFLGGNGKWGKREEITISGDEFERWALKVLLNHAAGKAFTANQGQIISPVPGQAVDYLLGHEPWPFGLGLCVPGDPANTDLAYDPFFYPEKFTSDWWGAYPMLRHGDQMLVGGLVELNGVGFGLSLFPVDRGYTEYNGVTNPFRGSLERPHFIEWKWRGVGKRINFTWSGETGDKHIIYTMKPKSKGRLRRLLPI